ncbi:hypothetical protein R0381_002914 [Jeongeupia wiesaeckerbachi]|uniref:hypothetical protein n=1 Tax=Jeongeupia wiesaeckerbachi TaxID=3051218 RepID=UPI003D808F34
MPDATIKRNEHSPLKLGILVLITCFSAYKLTEYLYSQVLSVHYRSYIPASFEIERTVYTGDRVGGFIEGCGVAVLELSEKTATKISIGQITFLNDNSITRDSKHKRHMGWRETPFISNQGEHSVFGSVANEDAGGNTCVDLPVRLKENILSAINRPGAFYSGFNENTELLVIPTLRLVVFSHDR